MNHRFRIGDRVLAYGEVWVVIELVNIVDEAFMPYFDGDKEVYIVDSDDGKRIGAGLYYLPHYDKVYMIGKELADYELVGGDNDVV
jgi:hypothetical protein